MINSLKNFALMDVQTRAAFSRIMKTSKSWEYLYSDTVNDLNNMDLEIQQGRNAIARQFVFFELFKGDVGTFPIRSKALRLISLVQRSMLMKFADISEPDSDGSMDADYGEMILMRVLSLVGKDINPNFPAMYYQRLSEAFGSDVENYDDLLRASIRACWLRETATFRDIANLDIGFADSITELAQQNLSLVDLSWLLPLFDDELPTDHVIQFAMQTIDFMAHAKYNDMISTLNSLLDAKK